MSEKLKPIHGDSWDFALVVALGGNPLRVAVLIFVLLLLSFFLPALFIDGYHIGGLDSENGGQLFGLDPFAGAAIVTALLVSYVICIAPFAVFSDMQDFERLLPSLKNGYELLESWAQNAKTYMPYARLSGLVGMAFGLVFMIFLVPGAASVIGLAAGDEPFYVIAAAIWFLVMGLLIFYLIGKGLFYTISESIFIKWQRDENLTVDLLNIEALTPLTRIAMRRSFVWILGSSISSLYFFTNTIDSIVLLPLFGGIILTALSVLLAPLYSLHKIIHAKKTQELGRVRDAIKAAVALIGSGDVAETTALQRLPGLLALEARIDSTREWTIDFGTASRFVFYLGIPVFSWIGGALVEKVVDSLI
ncbi:MAG: hypothetical protein GC184_04260 [Rhizobiales bacterium]|nr:hypothetical protein [Hyphomicrobiales bacterium]